MLGSFQICQLVYQMSGCERIKKLFDLPVGIPAVRV